MPNRHTTLTSLFTDIAGAIRSKTGDSAEIKADDFDTAIEAIPTGGGGGYTVNQLIGVDPIDSLTYDGTSLPDYALYHKTINNLSFHNLKTISGSALSNANTHSDLNTLFNKVETIKESGLFYFNEKINLTSECNVVFSKLINISYTALQNFGGSRPNEYKYSNYNNPKYNLIMPSLTSSTYLPAYYSHLIRNVSARN